MAELNFDATAIAPRASFEPIPAGKYQAVIIASVEKPTKAGNGSYIEFQLEIIEGEFSKRRVWERVNLNNPNDQAVSIARATLSAICHATGKLKMRATEELHDLPMTIKVIQKVNKETGEIGNEIKGYEPAGASIAPAPVTHKPAVPGSKPAWAKKSA